MTDIEFSSSMATRYIVIVKPAGEVMQDFYGNDDYSAAKAAYQIAQRYEKHEWIALVIRSREPGSPANHYHARLLDDRRDKSQAKINGLEGLINSVQSDLSLKGK